jgi:hypothetical protein
MVAPGFVCPLAAVAANNQSNAAAQLAHQADRLRQQFRETGRTRPRQKGALAKTWQSRPPESKNVSIGIPVCAARVLSADRLYHGCGVVSVRNGSFAGAWCSR